VDTLEVREVRETPARDVGEALDQQLGAAKIRKAGIASDVTLRGMKRDDVNVLVDGARVHGACPSRMDPPAFHLDYAEVDRVEVRRGPFDVSQPGGLGGLLDVRTRAAGQGLGTELNVGYASAAAVASSGVIAYGKERAGLLLGGSFKQSEPYRSGDGRNITEAVPATLGGAPNPGRFRDTSDHQTAYDVRSGWAKLNLLPAEGQRLELAYTRQSADDVLYPYLLMDGIADATDRVSASWSAGALGPLSRARGEAFWTRVAHDMDDRGRCSAAATPATCEGALPERWSMRTEGRTWTSGGKLEGVVGDPGELELRAGADLLVRNWDNVTTRIRRAAPGMPYASEASIPDVTQTMAGAYGELKRPLGGGVAATAGARLDVAYSRAAGDRSDLYAAFRPETVPARTRTDVLLGGNVQLDWEVGAGASLFAGYGHASRVPDAQERWMALSGMMGKPTWLGNPSLRPVQSDELDAGGRYAAGGVLLRAQAFHAWVSDLVVLAPLAVTPAGGGAPMTARTYENVRARLWGGEASARVALPLRLVASASLTYTLGQNERAGTPLAEMPPLRTSVSLRHDARFFFAEVEEQWAARQDRVDPALGEQPTPAWFITSVRAGVAWRGVKAFAGVRNLLDRQYVEHLSYQRDPFASGVKVPEPGRTFYSNVQYSY
ncbi:MAG TPA: TonB-dependent receptor, partial [Anaeromyxobacteraceae bacterium]|nr:TonB-dependent receptor [Anaeromyxobacteraceae bacterium]